MPSRSSDPLDAVLTGATEQIRSAVAGLGVPNPVVVIDGRSGAGKTSLAARLVRAWPLPQPVQLFALDSVYPGWDGLTRGAEIARQGALLPHSRQRIGRWHRWDWQHDEPAEAHAVDPDLGLIVEGCGALTRASAPLAHMTVWVDGPASARRNRALERDGDVFRDHWDMWAAQEDAHIAREQPAQLATMVFTTP
ncbi:hypothetical protein [Microbacterium esteraromaticum]|uniref:hypothetical protein n=1 Tax=Microbacterium esteraromaticum TaxID=57043 RepID=UPI0019D37336|nr:hypothetical protein [Microbacterium esteraromaticum]MBN7792676.1 hypothetical protein [Microbacterium esteraromaticum]